jgi:hypothetical protein
VVAPPDYQLSSGLNLLRKLTGEDYRLLAGQFAAQWPDDVARERMQASLEPANFYNGWIASLRAARTAEANPLGMWEATRAEHVARRLGEQLVAAGVGEARAAEILANARPATGPRIPRVRAMDDGDARHHQSKGWAKKDALSPLLAGPEVQSLREILHLAIDRMTLNDLRDIRVPIGLLLEIDRQQST